MNTFELTFLLLCLIGVTYLFVSLYRAVFPRRNRRKGLPAPSSNCERNYTICTREFVGRR